LAQSDDIRGFLGTGLDQDSAPENVAPNDLINAVNTRFTGSQSQQSGYGSNIESTNELSGSLLPGINSISGGGVFPDSGQILIARTNSAGNNQLLLYNFTTNAYEVIYTDLTDSAGIPLLPLDPQQEFLAILINGIYAIWWANGLGVGYTNLQTLASGGYKTVTAFTLTPGSGYTNDTYTLTALTGGTGTGAIANIIVAGGVVTSVIIIPGTDTGYTVGDVLTGLLPGGGTGFQITVTLTIIWEDLSLLKPQNPLPLNPVPNATSPGVITSGFGSDAGQPANYLYSHLAQFIAQGVNSDFNYYAWGTRSKRFTPYQENTPILGVGVGQNNYIIVPVYIWSPRIAVLNVAVQFDDTGQYYNIKSVDMAYVYALPNTAIDVSNEIEEAYDPVANIYYFVFRNNTVKIPVDINETNLLNDYIYPSNAGGLLNGNIPALGDWTIPYARPVILVTVAGVGYNPNIQIPANTYNNSLRAGASFPGASGSGAGNHRRTMWIQLFGVPQTGDIVVIITADIRNAIATRNLSYPVPQALNGNLVGVVSAIAQIVSGSYFAISGGGYEINWTDVPYYGLQTFSVELYFGGAAVANSIETVPDNLPLQVAIAVWDDKGLPLPITTDDTYKVAMPSFAQQNGNASEINITINNATAPITTGTYQIMISEPPVTALIETVACLINYLGGWDSLTNTPGLSINSGNIGDTYQITDPSSPATPTSGGTGYHNLGTNDTYDTGNYVTDVGGTSGGSNAGQYYTVVPRTFGNLAENQGGILVLSINSLSLLNAQFAAQGVTTQLAYSFTPGDRCTLHYFLPTSGGLGQNNPITPGTGYTDGVYTGVALSGGSGTGAVATVTVVGGIVTNVLITTPGTGYVAGDTGITGTVTGGSGWSISVNQLGPVYFNQPCIDLAVLGYDAGSYLVKVENSSALTFSSGPNHIYYNGQQIDARNIFIRLYSPAPQTGSASSTLNTTVFREIGQVYPITNGLFTQLNITVTVGGAYFLTREYPDAILPYSNPPVQVLATSLSYSDYYTSNYYSFGRSRTYYDVLEASEQKALIITGQPYIIGSKVNGLNRFYPINIYGNNNGQCSSSKGGIQIMWQRGQILWVLQQLGVFRIPVNEAYTVVNDQITGQSLSSVLLNNGRYDEANVGIGLTKAFCSRESVLERGLPETGYFIDPNNSLPFRIAGQVEPIAGKMSKYFKNTLQAAYAAGLRIIFYYNDYYEEPTLCIQPPSAVVTAIPFTSDNWNPYNTYNITPGQISAETNGSHSTVAFDNTTGLATYTPASNYVGSDVATFTFNPGSGNITLNVCLAWLAGTTTVNPFSFAPLINQPLSTTLYSGFITVSGPNIGVAISVSGGQYSINGGAFTSAAGTTYAGDVIQVSNVSSGSNSTMTTTALTIGATSAPFNVTTQASSPAFNVTVNNFNGNGAAITGSSEVGSTPFGPVYPGGSANFNVSSGTYTVIVGTGAGGSRTCTVNGVAQTAPGNRVFNFPSVSTPISIVLT